MYNEGKDSSYTDGYNQGLLEGHDNGWDEAKEYYQKIFERELREAKQQWKEEGRNNEYSEELQVDDEWLSYGMKKYSKETNESSDWEGSLRITPMISIGIPSSIIRLPDKNRASVVLMQIMR
jgi:hypothetical protein